jgi:hypothetical protein
MTRLPSPIIDPAGDKWLVMTSVECDIRRNRVPTRDTRPNEGDGMSLKKVGLGVAVLMLSAVLGATVLREPIASAASPFQNVIIGTRLPSRCR